ncbi:hypothetical protein E2C01_007157 [Portunus trituberculatus]|uniref:Uncharacterized protein n=1 Tax=Portunus trituberculatus TaxID=210409 RepID=A0A5B7CZQ8_PORTR|nr:hypothetical protein [Portunus trituberculatus]
MDGSEEGIGDGKLVGGDERDGREGGMRNGRRDREVIMMRVREEQRTESELGRLGTGVGWGIFGCVWDPCTTPTHPCASLPTPDATRTHEHLGVLKKRPMPLGR